MDSDSKVDMFWVELATGQMKSTKRGGIKSPTKIEEDMTSAMSFQAILGEASLLEEDGVREQSPQKPEPFKYEPGSLLRDVERLLSLLAAHEGTWAALPVARVVRW